MPWMRPLLTRALVCVAAAAALLAAACAREAGPRPQRLFGYAQGTTYTMQWWRLPEFASSSAAPAGKVDAVAAAVEAELDRLDRLLSSYRSDSTVEVFNATRSVAPQAVPSELVTLVTLAREVHAASEGCFDATVRPIVRAWGFDADAPAVVERRALDALRARIGMPLVEIVDAGHLRKAVAGVELDLSSIGQGYTASRLAAVLESQGIANYLVEIGGEIVGRGRRADGAPWRVGIESPAAKEPAVLRTVIIPPDGPATAVLTSGTYRKFFTSDGRRYSHILDPRTLAPVEHALAAVTVVGHDGAAAAAWATALVCLGPEAALRVAEREGIAALLLIERDGKVEMRAAARFPPR
jgi:thiamine biosynthesis lipoprotein